MRLVNSKFFKALRQKLRVISTLGWVVLVLSCVALFFGRRFNWLEFTVFAFAGFLLLIVAGVMSVGRSRYTVTLQLADTAVSVGQRAHGSIVVENRSRYRLLPAYIELPVGRGSADFALPLMPPGAEHDEVFVIPTSRRSVVEVGPVLSVRSDPLGLVRRSQKWADSINLYVHPLLVSLSRFETGLIKDLEGQATTTLSDTDMSFHSMREYVPGDDLRTIHWRTTARLQKLMVRELQDTRKTQVALALASDMAAFASLDEYELAVSVFASLGVVGIRELDVSAFNGGQYLPSHSPLSFLNACAGVTPEADPTRSARFTTELGRIDNCTRAITMRAAAASLVIIVTGSRVSSEERIRACHFLGTGVRVLLVSVQPGAQVYQRTVNLITEATVGSLDDLRVLLRQVVGA